MVHHDTWNPVATALETKIENPIYQNNINLFLNFKPMKGLSLKIMGGGTFQIPITADTRIQKQGTDLQ